MTWGEGKVTRSSSSGTQTGTGSAVQKTGESAASRVSLGMGLGLVASLFGVIQGLKMNGGKSCPLTSCFPVGLVGSASATRGLAKSSQAHEAVIPNWKAQVLAR